MNEILKSSRMLGRFARMGVLLCAFVSAAVFAETVVSGAIAVNTTWRTADGPFVVNGDVNVQNNAVLTIEAGTQIYMASGTNLSVNAGTVRALGTTSAPILVRSNKVRAGQAPAAGDWSQWVFNAGSSSSVLEHMVFQHGKGLSVKASAPTFNYLSITDQQGAAITLDLAASPKGVGNQATGNTVNAISVPPGDVSGSVSWSLRGIPYLVTGGLVSVGQSPSIGSVVPNEVPQGESVDAIVSGQRLDGLTRLDIGGNLIVSIRPGASSNSIPVTLTAPESAPLGTVNLSAQVSAGRVERTGAVLVTAKRNLLAVDTLAPASLRRGESLAFSATGAYLGGSAIVPSAAGLAVSGLTATPNTVNFNLTASANAPIGAMSLEFSSPLSLGKVIKTVNVRPAAPTVATTPAIVGLLTNATGTLTLSLSNADDVDHTFNLQMANPGLVSVSPASITIPANSITSTAVTLGAGSSNGATTLQVASTDGAVPSVNTIVMVGNMLESVSPGLMASGTGPNLLKVTGFGLRNATSIKINTTPNSAANHPTISVGAVQAAADGTSLTVPVTLSGNTPAQAFYVTVWQGASSVGVASPNADKMDVVLVNSDVFAVSTGVDVGGVGGQTQTTVLAVPAGVDLGGVSGQTTTTIVASAAGVDVGGVSGQLTTTTLANAVGVDVGGVSGQITTTILTTPVGVEVGGTSGVTTTQVFATTAGVDVGPVLSVTSGLSVWLKADSGTTVSNGKVQAWANQVGGLGNATVWSGVDGPALVPGALNGKQVLRFNAAQALQLPSTVLSSQAFTVVAVVSDTRAAPVADFDTREVFSNWGTSNTSSAVFLGTTGYAGKTPLRFTDCLGGFSDTHFTRHGVGAVGSAAQHFVLTGLNMGDDAQMFVNNQLLGRRGFAIPSRSYTTPFAIGRKGSEASNYWMGDIAEVLVFNRALDPNTELALVWSYLTNKYNLGAATGLESDNSPVGYCPGVGVEWFN